MKTIGLIGGMSFESSAVYYRQINEAVRARLGGLASAEVIMHSVNFEEIVAMQKASRWDQAADRLSRAAEGLERAGADCILICTNTMHLIADEVARRVSIPLINIIDVTATSLAASSARRPLLLATRYSMEQGFYAERMRKHGIEIMVPDADDRTATHNIIFDELCAGSVRDCSRETLLGIIEKARTAGADSVILGCTEICMILDPAALSLPGFDSTTIHAEGAVDFALSAERDRKAA
jgi:aspartate racemase